MLEHIALWLALQAVKNEPKPVDFARDVRPILEQHCHPCHFAGGKVYAKMPFDQPATLHKLGTKLFTRIKKDDEQKVIRAFLNGRTGS